MRRLIVAFAHAHAERPGVAVPSDQLVATGWPGERMRLESARGRLKVMVSRLRELGLRDLLRADHEGYFLDPSVSVDIVDAS